MMQEYIEVLYLYFTLLSSTTEYLKLLERLRVRVLK